MLSPAFYRPLPAAAEMAADLAAQLARLDHEQDILDLARRWANDRRFQVGVQQLKAIVRPAEAGLAYSDIAARHDLRAVRPGRAALSPTRMAASAASAWP